MAGNSELGIPGIEINAALRIAALGHAIAKDWVKSSVSGPSAASLHALVGGLKYSRYVVTLKRAIPMRNWLQGFEDDRFYIFHSPSLTHCRVFLPILQRHAQQHIHQCHGSRLKLRSRGSGILLRL